MNFRGSPALSAVAVPLVAYVYLVEIRGEREQEAAEASGLLDLPEGWLCDSLAPGVLGLALLAAQLVAHLTAPRGLVVSRALIVGRRRAVFLSARCDVSVRPQLLAEACVTRRTSSPRPP